MLPETLAQRRPSGHICRECFIRLYTLSLYTLSTHAFEKYFGPIRPGLPLQLMLDHELLWARLPHKCLSPWIWKRSIGDTTN
jgi:hypothetical protein